MNNDVPTIVRGVLLFILVNSFVFGITAVSAEAPGVIVIIGSDTTWTKGDSPHTFSGPVLVSQGVTLTVEAGATVDLNGYEMRVNGTLRAIGTSVNRIVFENGKITFTEYSNAWDEKTGTGSIIQFAVLEAVEIVNSVPVSINENPVSDDNLWSKEESPIELTESVVVGEGEVLTIEAGVTVEMQGYDLIVEGTLRVLGSSSDKVYFKSGPYNIPAIIFVPTSNGWNEQTATGSIIDNAIVGRITVVSNTSIKISNSNLTYRTFVEGSSVVIGNTLKFLSMCGGSVVCSNNNITQITACYGSPEISNNTIELVCGSGGSPVFSGNNITELGRLLPHDYRTVEWFRADSLTVSNNIIQRGLYAVTESARIFNNTITSYTYSHSYTEVEMLNGWPARRTYTDYITTSGITLIGGGYVEGNTISGCENGIQGGTTIVRNLLTENKIGVVVDSSTLIQSNTFIGNIVAIKSESSSPVEIMNNLISNNVFGTRVNPDSHITLQNNTYDGNQVAIELNQPSSTTISYNDFESCTQNSIYLVDTSNNIDASNNWWGTTDPQAINLTIYDYKYEFGLGRVNFTPFLDEPNPEAVPNEIPEFSAWLVLLLFLVATLVGSVYRKRMKKQEIV